MKHFIATAVMASSLLFGSNALAASSSAAQKESSPEQSGGTFKYSTDSKIATEQKNVYDTIIKYQNALNAGDTKTILGLFADESYSQWNDKLIQKNARGSTMICSSVKSLRPILRLTLSGSTEIPRLSALTTMWVLL
jgi:uncharacterized protein YyaL (SSP411 family)